MAIVFKLNPRKIRHQLLARRNQRIAALVCGRKVPTVEVDEGRVALLPNGAMPWAKRMGIEVYSVLDAARDAG